MDRVIAAQARDRYREASDRVLLGDRVYYSLWAENTADKLQTRFAITRRCEKAELIRGLH